LTLVVAALLQRVPASSLILVSRSPDSLQDFVRLGVAVRYGDFERPDSLPAAFAGGQRALVISTVGVQESAAAHRVAFVEELGGRPIVHSEVGDAEYEHYRAAFSADPDNAAYFELFTGTG